MPPDARARGVPRLLARLQRLLAARNAQRSARAERVLLVLALALFVGGAVVAWRTLPSGVGTEISWTLLLLAALTGPTATAVLNGAEYQATARILGLRAPFGDALRVSLLSTAANMLPIPGSVLVRTRALRNLGSTTGRAVGAAALVGLAWVATTLALVGLVRLPLRPLPVALGLLAAGVAGLALFAVLVRRKAAHADAGVAALVARVVAIEVASVAVGAYRLWLVLHAIGADVTLAQAVALTVASVAASATGIFPGGLGIRELVAAGVGSAVGVPAPVALLGAAVDRVAELVVLALMATIAFRGAPSVRGPVEAS